MRKRRYDTVGERNISVKSSWSQAAANLLTISFDAVDNDSRWHCECFSRRLGNIVRYIWAYPEVLCSFFFGNLRWTNLTWFGEKLKLKYERLFKLCFDGAAMCWKAELCLMSCDESHPATWIKLSHLVTIWLIIYNDFPTSSWFSGTWYLSAQGWLFVDVLFSFQRISGWKIWHFSHFWKFYILNCWLLRLSVCHGESFPCSCGFKFLSLSSWQLLT